MRAYLVNVVAVAVAVAAAVFVAVATGCGPKSTVAPVEPAAASVKTAEAAAVEPVTVVYFVRHAEKQTDAGRDPALTDAGTTRAQCLAEQLKAKDFTHVFTTHLRRTIATGAPLATVAGLTPEVITAGEEAQVLERLKALPKGATVLVVGHSNTVPKMILALGGKVENLDPRGFLPETDYDRLFEVSLGVDDAPAQAQETRYCAPSPTVPEAPPPST